MHKEHMHREMNERGDEVHDELQITCNRVREFLVKLVHFSGSTIRIRRSQFLHHNLNELLHREP